MGAIIIFIGLCGLYFMPSIVADGKPQHVGVFTLNLLLGWTVLGWVVALIWAYSGGAASPSGATFCGTCGAANFAGAQFCRQCGRPANAQIVHRARVLK